MSIRISHKENYEKRAQVLPGQVELNSQTYNLIIGGILLYGFVINALLTAFLGEEAIEIIYGNEAVFFIGYTICVIVGSLLISKASNSVMCFIGYNLIVIPVGLIIAALVTAFIDFGYANVVSTAFVLTSIITVVMMILGAVFEDFFLNIGRTLITVLFVTIIVELIFSLLGANLAIIDYIVVGLFSLFIGFDWARANKYAKTSENAIYFASQLYLDIVNIFIRLLSILARSSRN